MKKLQELLTEGRLEHNDHEDDEGQGDLAEEDEEEEDELMCVSGGLLRVARNTRFGWVAPLS
eukprot:3083863-Prorocentrum_lima.AAC.1